MAVSFFDNDWQNEIVTGSYYMDNEGYSYAQRAYHENSTITVWQVPYLDSPLDVETLIWNSAARVYSVAVGEVNADSTNEVVTGGHYFDGWGYVAQLVVWHA